MCIKVDPLYKQNLSEWIYDQNKLVTYRYLSVSLGVNSNVAKQMLYEFREEELKKSKNVEKRIEAIYYISGLLKSIDGSSGENNFSTTLCHESKLEETKEKYLETYSLHIYSLQPIYKDNEELSKKLSKAVQEALFITDDEGRTAVEFGPFKTAEPSTKTTVKPPAQPEPKSEPKKTASKSISKSTDNVKIKTEKEEKIDPPKNEAKIKEETPPHKQEDKKSSQGGGQDKNRLKNMFAHAATIPKKEQPQKEVKEIKIEKIEHNEKIETKSKANLSSKSKGRTNRGGNASSKNKKEEKVGQKRKREKDILSSSEDDEEIDNVSKKPNLDSSSEDEDVSTSHKTKKNLKRVLRVVDSSSDNSDEEIRKKSPPPPSKISSSIKNETPPVKNETKLKEEEGNLPRRKRVTKTVSRQFMDDEGFMVTVKEQEMVSESDDGETPMEVEPTPSSSKSEKNTKVEKEKKIEKTEKTSPPLPQKAPRKKKVTQVGGVKQASITSFFTKKT